MTGARSNRKPRPLSARVVRERFHLRALGFLIMAGGSAVVGLAAYCALGYDAANVTADPAAYAQVIAGVAGMGVCFMLAGAVTFVASWSVR